MKVRQGISGRRSVWFVGVAAFGALQVAAMAAAHRPPAPVLVRGLPSLADAVAARRDLWGEAAMRRPNGASYEFFAPLLPPPRYVHADFRHYPLVLGAPGSRIRARLIANGSGVNLRGGSRSWADPGTPVVFRVGPDEFRFGDLRERVSDPHPAEGWLPIYAITYRHPYPVQAEGFVPVDVAPVRREAEVYRLEAFASTDPALARYGIVFVRFSLAAGTTGVISAETDPPGGATFADGRVLTTRGEAVIYADPRWKWARGALRAPLGPGSAATLAIATRPPADPGAFGLEVDTYARQRTRCEAAWKELIGRGMQVEVSAEPRVNHAWRNLLAQNHTLLTGDRILYSIGNQYESLYVGEGGDAALGMLAWGAEEETRRMLVPLLNSTRAGLENHQAGLKLLALLRYYWQTRDTAYLRAQRPRWEKELQRLLTSRTGEGGLYPKEQYAGDIKTPVYSLNVQAKAWRALHDLPHLLRAVGDAPLADRVGAEAQRLRTALDAALEKSIHREVSPPFLPNALLSRETLHDPIVSTRIGSYWNLLVGHVMGSRLYRPGTPEDAMLAKYQEQHGGLCMGMIRSGATDHGFWTGPDRVNPLYGTRYVLDVLRRDEPERALVSFYGMLAQGFTRETLVAGEGCTLAPVDPGGRFFYCPPNSAGNAHFLTMLRNLLVQDLDLDADGVPETLRLLFATSRRWLEDGRRIVVERAPTAFGPVTLRVISSLSRGEVLAQVSLPSRNTPRRTLLRLRLPDGWRVISANGGSGVLFPDRNGTLDLTGMAGTVSLRGIVRRK